MVVPCPGVDSTLKLPPTISTRSQGLKLKAVALVMFVVFALLMLAAPAGQSVGEPVLSQILERVAHYVRRFEDQFALVVSDEEYEQKDVVAREGRIRSRLTRRMRSEMMFAWLPEQETWLIARHVLVVESVGRSPSGKPDYPAVKTRIAARVSITVNPCCGLFLWSDIDIPVGRNGNGFCG
jgi:acyl-CoA synthetase (AMP-forming)/AMP-acid ligase II